MNNQLQFNFSNQEIDYNLILNKLQDYMLNENVIEKSIKNKLINDKLINGKKIKVINDYVKNDNVKNDNEKIDIVKIDIVKIDIVKIDNIVKIDDIVKNDDTEIKKPINSLFFPKEKDSLFWCFYIMKNGDSNYEMIEFKNLIVEKKLKIEYVEKLRKEKQLIKTYKFATLTHIENQLANEIRIDINTFLTLCVLENLNVFYVNKNTYFELQMNDTNIIHLIKKSTNKYGFTFGYVIDNKESETITNYRNELFKIDNINKPIKSISMYKVQELIDFCQTLSIETINSETKKNKNKNDLYETLIQYF